MMKRILTLFMLGFLSACWRNPTPYELHGARGAKVPTEYYLINQGDTLFGIAWRYGLDMQDLAVWNGILDPHRILAGDRIRLKPPVGMNITRVRPPEATPQGQIGWIWPTRGKVIREFIPNKPGHQGLKIQGLRGQPIHAVRGGTVAYVGVGISGYGRMVIIRHENRIFSAYGYLDKALVHEGQTVRQGQKIATMGISTQGMAALHFEMRQHGPSVNPYGFIGSKPRY